MREAIHIKNLGPINDIFIEDIKPMTVLIGESGSGKSTLMKTIALFRWINKMQNIRSYLKHSKISKSPFRFRMETYIKDCGLEQYVKGNTEITYTTEFAQDRKYEIKFANNKLKGTSTNSSDLIQKQDLRYNKISFISELRNIIPLWADKGASISGGYLGFYFHEVYNDFVVASDNLKQLKLAYLDVNFEVKKNKSNKKYLIKSKKNKNQQYEIELKNSSSGVQNAIPVSLIAEHFSTQFDFDESFNKTMLNYLSQADSITDFKPVENLGDIEKKICIHLEEPELSLFPDAQCEFISDLVSKCFVNNSNEIELMFSTHSPYIINHLNLLIKAFDKKQLVDDAHIDFEKLAVYQVEEGKLENLLVSKDRIINTNRLSDTINDIYDKYENL